MTDGTTSRLNFLLSTNGAPDSRSVTTGFVTSIVKLNGPTVVERFAAFVATI